MSRESLVPPTIIATVCLAGAVMSGIAAESKFAAANPLEAERDRLAADIAVVQQYGPDYTPPPGDPSLADLRYQHNTAAGSAFGENALGWGATGLSGILGACVLGNGWTLLTIARGRRED